MKLKLPAKIASQQDLLSMIREVKQFTSWFNHEAIKKKTGAKKTSAPPVVSPATTELLRHWRSQKPLNSQSLDELSRILEQYSRNAQSISVTLAAVPTPGIKQTIVEWCRDNLSDHILVNFQFNSVILGGMIVRFGSHVYDWSFRRQILANRSKFPETLRNV